ncbi:hypothetical protein CCYN2B_140104 [Capnocytophaga cynodegmi]|uniref:Uncharacterized protein n=1 Tax=Capnocytophaga cynodegmi TaxID=28189 RepID=A0A0B7H6H6_9FLAO|nr:hypothetical protein CCYN2B_140104 [Capnocytophaga cynodegmi]
MIFKTKNFPINPWVTMLFFDCTIIMYYFRFFMYLIDYKSVLCFELLLYGGLKIMNYQY